jgi:hypothetical protein
MSRTRWMGALLGALALAGCSDSTNPSSPTAIPAAEASDIGAAAGDEIEQSVGAITVSDGSADAASGSAASFSVTGVASIPTTCAPVDDDTDTDADGAPDAATFTFELPACSFTGFRGGSLEITGTVLVSDPTVSVSDFAYSATLTDLKFAFTGPIAARTYTATRNGTRTLTGNAQGVALSNQITVVRTFPSRADGTVSHNLLLAFTPAEGESLALDAPLPSGTFTESGTFTWNRGSTTRSFSVTTVDALVWDATCSTDRKIASGEIRATLGDGSYVRVVWSGCGEDPTVSYVS